MTQEALKLALEALEDRASLMKWQKARDAVKEALAQRTEQEPVAHWSDCAVHSEPAYPKGECDCGGIVAVADYTALSDKYVALSDKYVALKAQRTWVGLTDDEMEATFIECGGKWNGDFWKIEDADFHPFLRTIEAKLKEKNT